MSIMNEDSINTNRKLASRIPIIPLPIDKVNASMGGEIIVDFDAGKIMGRRPGSNEIVDLSGDRQQEDKYSTIGLGFSTGNLPLPFRYAFDERSITSANKMVRLLNFENAGENYIPFKDGSGYLSWGYLFDIIKSDMCRNPEVAEVKNNNNIILKAGGLYTSSNLSGIVNVKLIAGNENYSKILWKLSTGNNINCVFDTNVVIADSQLIVPNSTVTLVISTWNKGETWFVDSETSSYSKTIIDNNLSWGYIDSSGTEPVGIYKIRGVRTLNDYKELSKDNNTFYFIEETSQIYRGNQSFTSPFILVDDFPIENIAEEKLYINRNTLEGKIYINGNWIRCMKPFTDNIDDTVTDYDDFGVTKIAVINYLKSKIADAINSNNTEKLVSVESLLNLISSTIKPLATVDDNKIPTISAVKEFVAARLPENGLISDIEETNGLNVFGLNILYSDGTTKNVNIKTSKEISSGSVDLTKNQISLTRNDSTKLNIDISELIEYINGEDIDIRPSESVNANIDDNDVITFEVKIFSGENNLLRLHSDGEGNTGLYVDPVLDEGEDDEILLSNERGVKRSGYTVETSYDVEKRNTGIPNIDLVEQIMAPAIITASNKLEYDPNSAFTKIRRLYLAPTNNSITAQNNGILIPNISNYEEIRDQFSNNFNLKINDNVDLSLNQYMVSVVDEDDVEIIEDAQPNDLIHELENKPSYLKLTISANSHINEDNYYFGNNVEVLNGGTFNFENYTECNEEYGKIVCADFKFPLKFYTPEILSYFPISITYVASMDQYDALISQSDLGMYYAFLRCPCEYSSCMTYITLTTDCEMYPRIDVEYILGNETVDITELSQYFDDNDMYNIEDTDAILDTTINLKLEIYEGYYHYIPVTFGFFINYCFGVVPSPVEGEGGETWLFD